MLVLALVAGTIDNLLRPFFLRGQVELPIAWIFLSIMGGLLSFGLFGLLIGPVLAFACREAFLRLQSPTSPAPASPPPVLMNRRANPPRDAACRRPNRRSLPRESLFPTRRASRAKMTGLSLRTRNRSSVCS